MATVTRPAAGYTPENPITNQNKYQNDSAATSPRRSINSQKVDGDFNKAYDVLSNHDNRLEEVDTRLDNLEEGVFPAETITHADEILFHDVSDGGTPKKTTADQILKIPHASALLDLADIFSFKDASDEGNLKQALLSDLIDAIIPVGVILPYGGTTSPPRFLLLEGQTVKRDDYPRLFDVYGTTYGAGDGTTTFKLPDPRGEFLRGNDNGRGVDVGRILGSAQTDALQNITGTVTGVRRTLNGSPTGDGAFQVTTGASSQDSNAGSAATLNISFDASRVARTSTETRPRNVSTNFIVKI